MKILTLVVAATAIGAIAPAASANPHRHGHGFHRGPAYVAPFYPRFAYPSWYYAPLVAPYYAHAPVVIERPPVVVERRYVEVLPPRVLPREPAPPQYREGERSYAQVAPPPAPAATPSRLERYTLSATELFEFDKATLRLPQPKLDEIASVLVRDASIDRVTITGYTDRLGSDAYNQRLSVRRADAVKAYLVSKGTAQNRVYTEGKGEKQPVSGDKCKGMGEDRKNAKLIECLQPDRRVEIEVIGTRTR
jgi:OOP family OmpA-OmpF porin